MGHRCWLMKSEPTSFSIHDLSNNPRKTTFWDGVRNYQARNMLRDQMQVGDLAFFYHSNCVPPGIVGIVEVVKSGYPDVTAFDPENHHYDPGSSPDRPRWYGVDIRLKTQFDTLISLETLRKCQRLENMALVRPGNRLSVMPVSQDEWNAVLELERTAR